MGKYLVKIEPHFSNASQKIASSSNLLPFDSYIGSEELEEKEAEPDLVVPPQFANRSRLKTIVV